MNKSFFSEFAARALLVIAIIAGLYVAHVQTVALRDKRAKAIAQLEQAPNLVLDAAARKSDLARRSLDIDRVEQYIIARADIVQVIAKIEELAVQRQVTVQVPTIDEIQQVDEDGEIITASGPAQNVQLKVAVDGSPQDIVSFIHGVEHLPYLITLQDFALLSNPLVGKQEEPSVEGEAPATDPVPQPGHGEMIFILSVTQSNG